MNKKKTREDPRFLFYVFYYILLQIYLSLFADCYDSVNIAKKHIDLQSYSLENIAHSLGIKRMESHRAADDCIMTLEILTRLEILLSNTK